jgi:hypothetical protein
MLYRIPCADEKSFEMKNMIHSTYICNMNFYIHITYLCTFYMESIKCFLRDVMGRVRVPLTIFLERFPIRKIVSGTHAIPHTMRI